MKTLTNKDHFNIVRNATCETECFEAFYAQRYHFEVIIYDDEFIGVLSDCKDCEFHNASCYYAIDDYGKYAFESKRSVIRRDFFQFDSLNDAIEFCMKHQREAFAEY